MEEATTIIAPRDTRCGVSDKKNAVASADTPICFGTEEVEGVPDC